MNIWTQLSHECQPRLSQTITSHSAHILMHMLLVWVLCWYYWMTRCSPTWCLPLQDTSDQLHFCWHVMLCFCLTTQQLHVYLDGCPLTIITDHLLFVHSAMKLVAWISANFSSKAFSCPSTRLCKADTGLFKPYIMLWDIYTQGWVIHTRVKILHRRVRFSQRWRCTQNQIRLIIYWGDHWVWLYISLHILYCLYTNRIDSLVQH